MVTPGKKQMFPCYRSSAQCPDEGSFSPSQVFQPPLRPHAFPGILFLHLGSGSRFQKLPRSEAQCRADCNAAGQRVQERLWALTRGVNLSIPVKHSSELSLPFSKSQKHPA